MSENKDFRREIIGYKTPTFEVDVEKGRLRQFCHAIGETADIYVNEVEAKLAGYRSIPIPPTFLFCLEMERDDPYDWFKELSIPLGNVLHGEQSFKYHDIVCAGDRIKFSGEVVDAYDKKGGALQFIVHRNFVFFDTGVLAAEFDRTIVVQSRE